MARHARGDAAQHTANVDRALASRKAADQAAAAEAARRAKPVRVESERVR